MILNSLLVVVDYIFITTLVNTITRRSDCPRFGLESLGAMRVSCVRTNLIVGV